MKYRYLKGLAVMMAALMTCFSCSKSKDDVLEEYNGNEQPGEIPGFGENDGTIAGATFSLPAGVEFDGEIVGFESDEDYERNYSGDKIDWITTRAAALADNENISTRSTVKADVTLGSGMLVTVLIRLKNTTSSKIDVEFPAGLIFESATGAYQNGILLKKTKATVPAGGNIYNVVLQLYCGNASRSASNGSAKYLRPVVTNSELLLYLCSLVKNKKINYEENRGLIEQINYLVMVVRLQTIVWKVTDQGEVPNKEDLDYIAGLK